MRWPKRLGSYRRLLLPVVILGFVSLAIVSLPLFDTESPKPLKLHVDPAHQQLPRTEPPRPQQGPGACRRCVVMGNGGILRNMELGPLIDRFDTVIRLNSGPLGEFSGDVGNRTSIRVSYPEGTPRQWVDHDPQPLFVAVVYKAVDLSWLSAMINKHTVGLWDRLFFWQKVPDRIPLEPQRFRLLNLQLIRETAMGLLQYPPPQSRLWGLDPPRQVDMDLSLRGLLHVLWGGIQ
ncbi:lactosylceramide alpha-2,3-sialyltransferase isoform X2 [Gadus chalcogrammus]|uniref:lactosylceramide alpha-2,3-sialyltransferase isoform X2 n=1 Tax=Gadus chalcogrammus TaxID=1042646 RepID=UPI0024C48271|nr:lactosylceramide alpha-2,3-sialyltransferase isoform X2 [Gadus chalcogrammus]